MTESKPQRPKLERNSSSNRLATLASRIHPRFSFQLDPHGRRSRQLFTTTHPGRDGTLVASISDDAGNSLPSPPLPLAQGSQLTSTQQSGETSNNSNPSISFQAPDWNKPTLEQSAKNSIPSPTLPPPQFQTFPPTSWAPPEESRRTLARHWEQEQEREREESSARDPYVQSWTAEDRDITPPLSPITPTISHDGTATSIVTTPLAFERPLLRRSSSHPLATSPQLYTRENELVSDELQSGQTSLDHSLTPDAPLHRRRSADYVRFQDETFTDEEEFQLFALATTGLGPDELLRDNNALQPLAATAAPLPAINPVFPFPQPPLASPSARRRPQNLNLTSTLQPPHSHPNVFVSPIETTPTTIHALRQVAQLPHQEAVAPIRQRLHPQDIAWLRERGLLASVGVDEASGIPAYSVILPEDVVTDDAQIIGSTCDAPPGYDVSQAQAQFAHRVEATRRAQELRRRWERSNP